jgi:sigma-B regulation protein RsbU (phosphoserine phosphatase)
VQTFESICKPLGFFSDDTVRVVKTRMAPRDTLVLYTDGVSEAENENGDEFGVDGLRSFLAGQCLRCPTDLVRACKQQVAAFRGSRERADDETLLALQYAPDSCGKFAAA